MGICVGSLLVLCPFYHISVPYCILQVAWESNVRFFSNSIFYVQIMSKHSPEHCEEHWRFRLSSSLSLRFTGALPTTFPPSSSFAVYILLSFKTPTNVFPSTQSLLLLLLSLPKHRNLYLETNELIQPLLNGSIMWYSVEKEHTCSLPLGLLAWSWQKVLTFCEYASLITMCCVQGYLFHEIKQCVSHTQVL